MVSVGDRATPWRAGLTLADVIRELGLPNGYVLADLNGKFVWKKDWETTAVPDDAKVHFRWIVAGG